MLIPGELIAKRYRLERELGVGAMGAVWLATHTGLDTQVAVKLLRKELLSSAELLKRFEREAKVAASIQSRYVVKILDHGYHEGVPFIVMEHLEGEDLGDFLEAHFHSPLQQVEIIVNHVGRALAKAHDLGLVHRDIKPENIYLCLDDEDQLLVKVLDFGIVKNFADPNDSMANLTLPGVVMGTPYYCSPEQAEGRADLDHRSDLWSLAVVVYEIITGHKPFFGDRLAPVLIAIREAKFPPMASVAPPEVVKLLARSGLEAWMRKSLSRDPNDRFPNAAEFVAGFLEALKEPTLAQLEATIPLSEAQKYEHLFAPAHLTSIAPQPPAGPPPVDGFQDTVPVTDRDPHLMGIQRARQLSEARAANRARVGLIVAIAVLVLLVIVVVAAFLLGNQ